MVLLYFATSFACWDVVHITIYSIYVYSICVYIYIYMYACHSVLSNVNLNIETAENKPRCVRPSPSPPNHPSFKKFLLVHPNVFMAMSIQNMMVKHHCGPGCPIIAKWIRMANNQTVLPGIGYNIYVYTHICMCPYI